MGVPKSPEFTEFDGSPPEFPPPLDPELVTMQVNAEMALPELDTEAARERLEEVIEAAEAGEALEGELEKRHEIKENTQGQSDLASSVGQILAQIHQHTQNTHTAFQYSAQADGAHSPLINLFDKLPYASRLTPMYQRALLSGLAAGLTVTVILALRMLIAG